MNIASLVKASGKPRSVIIAEAGISQAYLSLLEKGERSIGHKRVDRLAAVLGVKPSDLRPDLYQVFSASLPSFEAFDADGVLPDANCGKQSAECKGMVSHTRTIEGGDA